MIKIKNDAIETKNTFEHHSTTISSNLMINFISFGSSIFFFDLCSITSFWTFDQHSDDSDIGLKWYYHSVLRYLMMFYSKYLHSNHLGVHFFFFSPNLTSVYVEFLKWSQKRVLAKSKPHFTYVSIFGWNFALNNYFTSMFLFMHSCV